MTDGREHRRTTAWGDGARRARGPSAILETRRAVFPLHGLDPDDPRD